MPSIYDYLAGSLGDEKDYYSQDPWYSAGANILKSQMPTPETSAQAFLFPFLQTAIGGGMLGYGKSNANESAYANYRKSPLLSSQESYGTEAMPEDWTPRQGRTDLAQMLIGKEQEDQLALEKQKSANQITQMLAGKGMIQSPEGSLVPIPGFADIEADAAGKKSAAQEGAKGGEDWLKKAPVAVQTKLLQADAVTQELHDLSQEFKKMNLSAPVFQATRSLSGTKANDATAKMQLLLAAVVRLSGDVGNLNEQEQARALSSTLGNWTSNTEEAGDRIAEAANLFRKLALRQAKQAKGSYTKGGGDSIITGLEQPFADSGSKSPPPAFPGETREQYKARIRGG